MHGWVTALIGIFGCKCPASCFLILSLVSICVHHVCIRIFALADWHAAGTYGKTGTPPSCNGLDLQVAKFLWHEQDVEAVTASKRMTAPKSFPRVALDLATTVERIQQNFCISDPSLPDCPIVFASDGFLAMSGYDRHEVLGRNCRFLQVCLFSDSLAERQCLW